MKTFDSRRHLRIETLEPRAMLSGNSVLLAAAPTVGIVATDAIAAPG